MVLMPFCSAKPEEEWRCFKLKTCASLAFAGSGMLENNCTPSSHFQFHVDLQSTEGSTERIWQSYNWWAVFLQGYQSGPYTAKSCRSVVRDLSIPRFSPQAGNVMSLTRTVMRGPISLQFSAIHLLSAGKWEQSITCRFNCEQVKLQNWKATTASA